MLQVLKRFIWAGLLVAGLQTSWAFSLSGPAAAYAGLPAGWPDAWQVTAIGFNPIGGLDGLLTGPKNIGEEYRRVTPVMYYACDQTFLDFFGANGLAEIDKAFAVYNNLTNVSSYSADLSEIPLESRGENFLAEALGLLDLKSTVMEIIAEQLGLADSVRYTWVLHDRFQPPATTCPISTEYWVVQRNFDIVASAPNQLQYSSYVNGVLYSYLINEYCSAANSPYPGPPPELADAIEFSPDPLANTFTPVSAGADTLFVGMFYTGLTRDDVGGLRYLLGANNVNRESAGPGTVTVVTNPIPQLLFVTNQLSVLAAASLTNNTAALQALFPGLIVASETITGFSNACIPNVSTIAVNYPWEPVGSPPHIISVTNGCTPTFLILYNHTFANIITNTFFTNSFVSFVTTTITTNVVTGTNGTTAVVTTNVVTTAPTPTNIIGGDFYIVPNTAGTCGFSIASNVLTFVTFDTNVLFTTTNGATGAVVTESLINYFTNHVLVYFLLQCPPATVEFRQGIERITFVRRDFDSLIGQFFTPVTNIYSLNMVTNNSVQKEVVLRTVNAPDILFGAVDHTPGPNADPGNLFSYFRNINFNFANELPGLAGPGTIETPTTITFNKSVPARLNISPFFLSEGSAVQSFYWGSFDATTNVPVVYPNGTSITNLENQILIQVSPATLPDGTNGVAYGSVQFTATGGLAPYAWSLAPGSPALPPGLTLSPTGLLSGTPTMSGTFDFVLQMTDAASRFVNVNYPITIHP